MRAYVIVGIEWHDAAAFEVYADRIADVVERHGGRFVASSTEVHAVEGDWHPERIVLIEFDSLESAHAWHESDEYRELLEIRRRGATTDLVVIPGLI